MWRFAVPSWSTGFCWSREGKSLYQFGRETRQSFRRGHSARRLAPRRSASSTTAKASFRPTRTPANSRRFSSPAQRCSRLARRYGPRRQARSPHRRSARLGRTAPIWLVLPLMAGMTSIATKSARGRTTRAASTRVRLHVCRRMPGTRLAGATPGTRHAGRGT